MKKILLIPALLFASIFCFAQRYIHGSIQQGAAANTVDILYKPNHNSSGEYIDYISISIAIDTSRVSGMTPSISGVGNFSAFTFTPATPFSYISGSEKVYSWIVINMSSFTMSWSNGTPFVGATITFTGGSDSAKVRMVDFSNVGGGTNGNTLFVVNCTLSPYDLTDYSNFFYATSGTNGSNTGIYGSGDQYVETKLKIDMHAPGARMAAPTPVKNSSIAVYPNPANAILNLTYSANTTGEINYSIFDANGKKVKQGSINGIKGSNKASIDISKIGKGTYFLKLENNGLENSTVTFVKQ